jgi:predicted transcriptional regulator
MTPMSSLTPVRASDPAYSVLERMVSEGQSLLPVMEESRLLGLVRQDKLLQFAQTRVSLGM